MPEPVTFRLDGFDYTGCTVRESLARFAQSNPHRKFWLRPWSWDYLYRETCNMTGVRVDEFEAGRVALVFPANGEMLIAMADASVGDQEVRARCSG